MIDYKKKFNRIPEPLEFFQSDKEYKKHINKKVKFKD